MNSTDMVGRRNEIESDPISLFLLLMGDDRPVIARSRPPGQILRSRLGYIRGAGQCVHD